MNLRTDMVYAIALTIPCPRCEAPVNERCTSISGGKAEIHASRAEPIYRSYALGYADALAEVGVSEVPVTA